MKRSARLVPLLFAVLLVCTGAREGGLQLVTHVAEAKKSVASIRFAESIKIVLPTPENPAPGFEWQIISNDTRVLRLTSSPKSVGSVDLPAGADKSVAPAKVNAWATSFVGLRPGRSIVRFVFVRASDGGEETPIDTREIIVTVRE
jgi:hypothetical protein